VAAADALCRAHRARGSPIHARSTDLRAQCRREPDPTCKPLCWPTAPTALCSAGCTLLPDATAPDAIRNRVRHDRIGPAWKMTIGRGAALSHSAATKVGRTAAKPLLLESLGLTGHASGRDGHRAAARDAGGEGHGSHRRRPTERSSAPRVRPRSPLSALVAEEPPLPESPRSDVGDATPKTVGSANG